MRATLPREARTNYTDSYSANVQSLQIYCVTGSLTHWGFPQCLRIWLRVAGINVHDFKLGSSVRRRQAAPGRFPVSDPISVAASQASAAESPPLKKRCRSGGRNPPKPRSSRRPPAPQPLRRRAHLVVTRAPGVRRSAQPESGRPQSRPAPTVLADAAERRRSSNTTRVTLRIASLSLPEHPTRL